MINTDKLIGMLLVVLGFVIIFYYFGEILFKIGLAIFGLTCIFYGLKLQGSSTSGWIMRGWINKNRW